MAVTSGRYKRFYISSYSRTRYREIHQNWKMHLHCVAGVRASAWWFALNPVRKRLTPRPSISRWGAPRRCSRDIANFLAYCRFMQRVILAGGLSISSLGAAREMTRSYTHLLKFYAIWDNMHSLCFFFVLSPMQFNPRIYPPTLHIVVCIFLWFWFSVTESNGSLSSILVKIIR